MLTLTRLRGLLGLKSQPKAPARVPTDQVLPVHFLDDTDMNREYICTWTMSFRDVLDADKLAAALSKLAEIGDWKKIGGRLRLNEDKKLELHVPQRFTPERPAVAYSHESFEVSIDEHPLASRLPKPTDGPSIQEGADAFEALAIGKGAPANLGDYIYTDHPQLSLHVVSFTDATLVTIIWLHTMSDAMGLRALVTNWAKVLAGKEAEVEPLKGVYEDPLASIGTGPKPPIEEPYLLTDKLLEGVKIVGFMLHFVWDMLWCSKHHMRSIYLPAATVASLHAGAISDLENDTSAMKLQSHPKTSKPFLSVGDVLAAWATKMICFPLGMSSTRPIAVLNMFELRGRLKTVFDATAAYMGNFFLPSWTLLKTGEVSSLPLGHTALTMRSALKAQTKEGQVRAILRKTRDTMKSKGRIPLAVGSSNGLMVTCTSWDKANIFEAADFRPALVRSRQSPRDQKTKPGRPVYFHGASITRNPMARNIINIIGKDLTGSYWMMGVFSPATWKVLEEEIQKMPAQTGP